VGGPRWRRRCGAGRARRRRRRRTSTAASMVRVARPRLSPRSRRSGTRVSPHSRGLRARLVAKSRIPRVSPHSCAGGPRLGRNSCRRRTPAPFPSMPFAGAPNTAAGRHGQPLERHSGRTLGSMRRRSSTPPGLATDVVRCLRADRDEDVEAAAGFGEPEPVVDEAGGGDAGGRLGGAAEPRPEALGPGREVGPGGATVVAALLEREEDAGGTHVLECAARHVRAAGLAVPERERAGGEHRIAGATGGAGRAVRPAQRAAAPAGSPRRA
jgi:hypothetical protein